MITFVIEQVIELSTYAYFKTQVKVCYLTIQKLLHSEFAFI